MAECAKKAILITGCDSGFGFSLACHLSETKPDLLTLACCYIADSEGSTILRSKPNVQVLQLDVTSPQSISKLVKDVDAILDEHKGQLWAVVNNAATLVFADAMWQTR
jgi:3-hydroxybutyrate dehydrogenase